MALRTIMTGDVQKTALRLPRLLHEKILVAAEINRRSMNTEIVARLEDSFAMGTDSDRARLIELKNQIDEYLRDTQREVMKNVEDAAFGKNRNQ